MREILLLSSLLLRGLAAVQSQPCRQKSARHLVIVHRHVGWCRKCEFGSTLCSSACSTCCYFNALAMALAIPIVVRFPPQSGTVCLLCNASITPLSIALAAFRHFASSWRSPSQSNIILAANIIEIGFAVCLPALLGAEP